MAHPGFGHLWQQAEMSDLDIVISCDYAAAVGEDASGEPEDGFVLAYRQLLPQSQQDTLLQQFPGHSTILSLSPFFKAQALRWSTPSQPQGRTRKGKGKAASKRQAKQQVTITLPDASYEPAAIAVLKGLYKVEPWPRLLADLTPQQQVQAAVLADMWQLEAASEAAVALLQEPAGSNERMSAVLEQLLSMAAVPDCLIPLFEQSRQGLLSKYLYAAAVPANVQPLFEQALLSKYGDLEAVWSPDAASLQESLLTLPLRVMELLLASDRLKVASEATVLFTAQAYVDKLARAGFVISQQQAVEKLAPLVRCPHLSLSWLSASVLSDDADKLLLRGLQPQLKQLLLLKASRKSDTSLSAVKIKESVLNVPASWLLPVRDTTPVSSGSMQWEVEVAAIREVAQKSFKQQSSTVLKSTPTCLLGGINWGIELYAYPKAEGTMIGVYARAKSLPAGALCDCAYSIECVGVALGVNSAKASKLFHNLERRTAWGASDYFDLGVMSGGFDEAAWAAKGLPTSGSIVLKLTVADVGM